MSEHIEILALLKDIQTNQQSLHDDMSAVVDRLTKLENVIVELTQHSNQPATVDEHQLYLAARALVVESGKCSTSYLQRIFRIGYSRAARLIDALEENGVVSAQDSLRPREILLTSEELESFTEREENDDTVLPITASDDDLYEDAKQAVIEAGKASTSYLQRKLRIGYTRAERLIKLLEDEGIIGPQIGAKPRELLSND